MIGSLVRNLQNSNNKAKLGLKDLSDEEENDEKESVSSRREETKRKYAKARSRLPLDTNC
jgi:hypothetical protein